MIEIISFSEAEKWNNIVKSFKNSDIYYQNGYPKAFSLIGDGVPELIYYENGYTRGINVVMLRDIHSFKPLSKFIEIGQYYDLSTPYGYGGFIIEGEDYRSLASEYIELCRSRNIVSEFVRFNPLLNNWHKGECLYDISHLGYTVSIDTSSPELIWENIHSKNRNVIRKAKNAGLKVYWGRNPRYNKQFMKIYNETMARDNAEQYFYFPEEFYESIINDLKYNSMWFCTQLGNEVTAIAIFLFSNEYMHYHLSASRKEYMSLAPTNLLIYEAALWASNNGYKELHLGGGLGAKCDSLYKFKKSFNKGRDKEFWVGKKIFNPSSYNELVKYRTQEMGFDKNNTFFPRYRG